MFKNLSFLLIIFVLFNGCSSSRLVVPLDWRDKTITVSSGGVLENQDESTYIIPSLDITYTYGYTKTTSTFVGLLITPATENVFLSEWGFLHEWKYFKKSKLGFTTSSLIHLGYDAQFKKMVYHPQLDWNWYWHFWGDRKFHCGCPGDRRLPQFIYLGGMNYWQLNGQDYFTRNQSAKYLHAFHLGYSMGTALWRFNLEGKLYMPFKQNDVAVFEPYRPYFEGGAYGVFINFTHYLSDKILHK